MKPKKVPKGTSAIPLVMVHGWPGSFYEFYGMIPLLTEPSDPDALVFEVVCPSIPGYGFSEAPHKKGTAVKASNGYHCSVPARSHVYCRSLNHFTANRTT